MILVVFCVSSEVQGSDKMKGEHQFSVISQAKNAKYLLFLASKI